ncbi:MAG: hypothetical protein JWN64_745 [Parcubacteria group bacterium]|nr:hypothetical protein [Parcubacteria group bacterium]
MVSSLRRCWNLFATCDRFCLEGGSAMWIEEYTYGPPISEEERQRHVAAIEEALQKYREYLEARGEVICQLWSIHDIDRRHSHQFCSLHIDDLKRKDFHKRYNSSLPETAPDTYYAFARDEHSRLIPTYHCRVDATIYRRIKDSDIGLWCVTIPMDTVEAVALIPPNDFISLTEGLMPAR